MGARRARLVLAAAGLAVRAHPRILSAAQAKVLARLGPLLSGRGFYLAGGTGLALRLGHRRSVDFDWFRGEPIVDPLRLARELQGAIPLVVVRTERGTLHATLFGVRLSFIEYGYPLLGRLVEWKMNSVRVAALEDIACMKLAAVAQRGSRRDFVDVFALGRRIPLRRMLELYRRKYGIRDSGHVLFALTYFDDAEKEPMPRMLRPWSWSTIKRAVRSWAAEVAR